MKKTLLCGAFLLGAFFPAGAQNNRAEVSVQVDSGKYTISKHIYGHFSEHLGRGIYGGLWVGEDSPIPNVNGVRKDIIDALKHIRIPNLRWPGGCFADEYHWMDGIGPRSQRPKMINTHWGGVVEDNAFGTHEFLNLCEELGTEPYIAGNMGSGTVEEMSKWVEYITFDGESPMANLRRENGREEPWKVKYWGVGNENWGCGGHMSAEYYAGEYRRYATYCRNYGDNILYKVIGGPNTDDYHWMEVMMREIRENRHGVSLHYYTIPDNWTNKGPAVDFNEGDYYRTVRKAYFMDELVTKHAAVMDKYDPGKEIGLIVDEWGNWFDVQPGTNPGFLYQQNTLRDAITAGTHLNIFNNHADRVALANIAQLINVLQALFLTEGEQMILTPTYHVFDMYKVHHQATMLPVSVNSERLKDNENREFPQVNVSASVDANGIVHLSLVNTDLQNNVELSCVLASSRKLAKNGGKIITSPDIRDYNSFEQPNRIVLYDFNDYTVKDNRLTLKIPAKSVVTLSLK